MSSTLSVLVEVASERKRQDAKWGEPNQEVLHRLGILAEEFGEVSKEVVDLVSYRGTPQVDKEWQHAANLRQELVQTAAVAVANIEVLDRQYEGLREASHV